MKYIFVLSVLIITAVFSSNAQSYGISTVAGNGLTNYSGDGGPATAAEIGSPYGIATDTSGNFYITDYGDNVIRKVNTSGIISTIAGIAAGGFSGDSGAATAAKINGPTGIAVDRAGNIYFTDYYNYRIRKITTGGIIYAVAGNGSQGFSGDGGPATSAELGIPYGVAVDNIGNVYIADEYENRIRKIDTNGIISTVAGSSMTQGFSGDGGLATAAELASPSGVAADTSGNIYIADQNNSRIRKVNTSGIISTVAGNGAGSFSGDGGQATAAEINFAIGVSVDYAGNIYIGDQLNNRIRKVDKSGIISTIAGNGSAGFSGDGGQATAAELSYPAAVNWASSGNIYIVDYNDFHARKLCPLTATPGIIAGNTVVCSGSSQNYSISAVPGAASYTWTLPGGWTGTSTSTSINVTVGINSGNISVTANNACGSSSAQTLNVTVRSPQSASICYVSVDTASKHNEIFWDKSTLDTLAIDSFRIYRKITSFYKQIGSVPANAYSSFVDTTSNPNTASQLYKISILDTCGQEGALSLNHQTILLQASIGVGGVVNLSWNAYVGDTVNYYRILRDDFGTGAWHKLDSVSNTVFAYTDLTPPVSSNVRYLLSTIWNLNCAPSAIIAKRQSDNNSPDRIAGLNYTLTSYSNRKNLVVTGINELSNDNSVTIYPNPAKDVLTISMHEAISGLSIYNVLGELVYSDELDCANNTVKHIEIGNLSQGVYTLKIKTGTHFIIKKIVKL